MFDPNAHIPRPKAMSATDDQIAVIRRYLQSVQNIVQGFTVSLANMSLIYQFWGCCPRRFQFQMLH